MDNKFKKTVSSMLEIPKEVVLNLPVVSILGNEELTLENYKKIIEYSEERVRVSTSSGSVLLCGRNLSLKQITSDSIIVSGFILKLEFLN